MRDYAIEHLGTDDAVLVIDETGFLKQGRVSYGVARQYTGSAGKVTNCQIGVFAAYVSVKGRAFVDRALYLPKSWTANPLRPAAVEMIERAIAANIPFAWVAADAVYGVGDIEQALLRAGKGYVLGVKGDPSLGSWGDKPVVAGTAAKIASDLDPAAWHRLSAGNGTKGVRGGVLGLSRTRQP